MPGGSSPLTIVLLSASAIYGHLGDGNLHLNVLGFSPAWHPLCVQVQVADDCEEIARLAAASDEHSASGMFVGKR
jgi:hypothetical protein